MAIIVGTAANDVLVGTTTADRIEGGAGNDRINAGAGDDEIFGGDGSDTLTGDAGNDRIFGESGNDGVYGGGGNDYIDGGVGDDVLFGDGGDDHILGGAGNDKLYGGIGNDRLEGGAGNDLLFGEAGDDVFVYRTGDGSDTIVGGQGSDRLELELTGADVTDDLRADLAAFQAWSAAQLAAAGSAGNLAAQTTGATFTFASLGVTVSAVEALAVFVDGKPVALDDLLNRAPEAAAEADFKVAEDGVLEGVMKGSDADGDALTFAVETGPALGTVKLDAATGAFVYTPAANVSGADAFTVRVSDPSGASVVQVVAVTVAAIADTPTLATKDAVVSLVRPITGTSGNDVLKGDQYAATATVALAVAAALNDRDGSETLSVRIAGVPAGGVLSAGAQQKDGTWLLQAADLAGLTLTAPTAADIALEVTAVATEADGGSASAAGSLQVTFDRGGFADTFIASAGDDSYDGGAGFDTIDYSSSANAVRVDLSRSTASGYGNDTIRNIEGVIGTSGGDRLTGDNFDNVLDGGAGDDRIDGGGGNDIIIGGAGNDTYNGGSGFDTLDFSQSAHGIEIDAQKTSITTTNGKSNYSNIEKLVGSAHDDVFLGSKGVDVFVGGDGDDVVRGFEGADVFTGGAGNDTFIWHTKDVVSGKKALGPDTITDFSAGDVLDISAITEGAPAASVVQIADTAEGSMLAVKIGGNFVDVVLLENVHGVTAGGLAADGWLIV